MNNEFVSYAVDQAAKILSIDSPSGFTRKAAEYVFEEYRKLGFHPVMTNKGGVVVCVSEGTQPSYPDNKNICLTGEPLDPAKGPVLFQAHLDTLGGMVTEITGNGRLRITNLGGLNPNNTETESVRVHTRDGKVYEGTFQMTNASLHVNKKYNDTPRSWDTMEVVLDEIVRTQDETKALGISVGDFVCFDPRVNITKTGFIKSRFLDDKLSVAILLGHAKYLKETGAVTERKIYHFISVYEEVGHGGCASIPADVTEIISVDMGCVGTGLACDETMVSICVKDSGGPYDYDVTTALINAAKAANIDYAADYYPGYGSDAEASLRAGYDCRHGLIGPGVYASHGYERSHIKGVENTLSLMKAYLG